MYIRLLGLLKEIVVVMLISNIRISGLWREKRLTILLE